MIPLKVDPQDKDNESEQSSITLIYSTFLTRFAAGADHLYCTKVYSGNRLCILLLFMTLKQGNCGAKTAYVLPWMSHPSDTVGSRYEIDHPAKRRLIPYATHPPP